MRGTRDSASDGDKEDLGLDQKGESIGKKLPRNLRKICGVQQGEGGRSGSSPKKRGSDVTLGP